MYRWIFVGLISTGALAQTIQEPDRTVFRKRTQLDFSAMPVEGGSAKPSESYVPVRGRAILKSLMKIRGSFASELQKSVDQL